MHMLLYLKPHLEGREAGWGSPEEAVFEWKKAVIVDPESDAAAKAKDKLDKVAAHNTAVARSLEERLGMREKRS